MASAIDAPYDAPQLAKTLPEDLNKAQFRLSHEQLFWFRIIFLANMFGVIYSFIFGKE